jgi:hypothetical protein
MYLFQHAPTTNQVFSNPSTLTHTTHTSYIVGSEFNCLDDKFYYDLDIDWIFDFGATKHICQNHGAFTNFRIINETIKSSSGKDVVISGAGDAQSISKLGMRRRCVHLEMFSILQHSSNLLSVECIEAHDNYVTTKDGYQIVNRKVEKLYTLKQSIPNILYKDITEDSEQEKAFMAKVSLQTWHEHKRL